MPRKKKGAVFIRCTDKEAERIRQAAKLARQTVSSYILKTVLKPAIDEREETLRETVAAKTKP